MWPNGFYLTIKLHCTVAIMASRQLWKVHASRFLFGFFSDILPVKPHRPLACLRILLFKKLPYAAICIGCPPAANSHRPPIIAATGFQPRRNNSCIVSQMGFAGVCCSGGCSWAGIEAERPSVNRVINVTFVGSFMTAFIRQNTGRIRLSAPGRVLNESFCSQSSEPEHQTKSY